jgi:peptide/nickel transport system substrate-binding protein
VRRKLGAVLIGTLAVAIVATGCQKNTGTGSGNQSNQPSINNTFQVDNNAKGPVAEVPGAKRGGTITIVGSADLDRSAPWADYRGDGILLSSQLLTRTLTNYYEVIQPDGTIITKLLGDLATDTGKTTDCKTYTFTLRDGIKYQDGSTITSKDIAYGVSLTFASEFADGPTYVQKYLAGTDDFNSVYKGPYKESGKLAPNLETPDDKTIIFKFPSAHCDFPQAAALLSTVPLPQAKDPGAAKLETGFLASGPYKIASYIRGEKLTLVRNDQWDPSSDPWRHNYPDSYIFDWKGSDVDLVAKRFIADGPADQASIMWDNVPSAEVQDAVATPKSRQLEGDTVFNLYMYINNQRVTDVDVRRALLYSYNLDALKKIIGGDKAGTFPSTTILSPVTPGYKKFNAYPDNTLTGNIDKAKQLLQGKTLTPLKYCYRPGTPTREQTAAAAKQNLERSGFQIVLKPIDPVNFYPTVGKKDTDCDLIPAGWGQDFPSSSTVLGVLMKGGAAITPTGNNNLSYFDQPSVNAELDRLAAEPDPAKAAQGYGDLDEKIMRDYCPLVPLYYDHSFSLIGSKVGGAYLSGLWGAPSLQNIYFNG